MQNRINSLSSLLRLFISQYDLSGKHLFIMLSVPVVLAIASSFMVTSYLVEKKVHEVGEFNLKRLEDLLSQSESIGQYAITLSQGDCSDLNEYMKFKPYYRGVPVIPHLIFDLKNLTAIGHSDLLLSFAGNSSWPLPLSLSVTSTTLVWSLHFAKNSALLA